MSKQATAVNAVSVLGVHDLDRVITVGCPDFDAYRALPCALSYNGSTYGRTGWNSDRGVAYFRIGAPLAHPVKG